MAEEVFMVAFNIQDAGSSYKNISFSKKGSGSEASFPPATQETNSLQVAEGLTDPIATCKLVEVTAGSAAEAVEMVRKEFGQCSGKMRTVVKPNTSFKTVTP
jgi:hypothetical protein